MSVGTVRSGLYEHFKGKRYEVLGTARHSETLEEMVVYRALYRGDFPEGQLWVRPALMFAGTVMTPGGSRPRFRYLGPPEAGDGQADGR